MAYFLQYFKLICQPGYHQEKDTLSSYLQYLFVYTIYACSTSNFRIYVPMKAAYYFDRLRYVGSFERYKRQIILLLSIGLTHW